MAPVAERPDVCNPHCQQVFPRVAAAVLASLLRKSRASKHWQVEIQHLDPTLGLRAASPLDCVSCEAVKNRK